MRLRSKISSAILVLLILGIVCACILTERLDLLSSFVFFAICAIILAIVVTFFQLVIAALEKYLSGKEK